MDPIKESYFIDTKSNVIYSRTIWSRRYIKALTIKETEEHYKSSDITVFINWERDCLELVPTNDMQSLWDDKIKDHIVDGDVPSSTDDFPDGYYFHSEMWKAKNGKFVLVLSYHH